MSRDRERKEKRSMSYRTKWIITIVLLMIAVALVITCFAEGMFDFKPGVVKPNDEESVISTAGVDTDKNGEPKLSEYTVFVSAGNGGTANPNGRVTVDAWGSITVSFTPDEGYKVQSVVVDGADMGELSSYTLSYITSEHTIMVTFEKIPVPTPEPTEIIPDIEPED